MKTTLDLPDDLMRAVELRAVNENRKLKDVIADLLRRGLAEAASVPGSLRTRVRLPLVDCAHRARPAEELTPDRVAEVLIDQKAPGTGAEGR